MGSLAQKVLGLVLSAVVLGLVSTQVVAGSNAAAAGEQVIKIGAVTDFSGPASESSKAFSKGVRAYFDYVNRKGGINGRKIQYMETDCHYDMQAEMAGFKRYAMEGIPAFIGLSTGGTMQIAKQATGKRIVLFATSLFDMTKMSPYFFLPSADYARIWDACVTHAVSQNKNKKLKAVVVYPGNVFGKMMLKILRPMLKEKGLELVGTEIVGFRAIDATAQMIKVKKLNPDAVFCAALEASQSVIMRDAGKVGIDTKKVQFYNCAWAVGPIAIKLGGKDIEDLITGFPFSLWEETNLPGIKAMHENNPGLGPQSPVFTTGWTVALVISEGLRRIGDKKITGDNLKKSLETMKDFDTGGLTAPISYSLKEHVGTRGVKMYRPNLEKGYFEPVSDWIFVK